MENKERFEVVISGLGGSGLLTAGKVLAEAGTLVYKNVFYLPNYGPQMRMGECECTVSLSNDNITSQGSLNPPAALVFGTGALKDTGNRVRPGGKLFVDSTLVQEKLEREDIEIYYIPASKMAMEIGSPLVSNIILLGAYLEKTKALPENAILDALAK
ncbi:MAG: 2-oxoacid:acceptor oxidoreductase family protein, partial [Thermodesulfobacteriota bacterium]|nr:2-oxoacid:acceptor oxidoreductase family protein [Thermodesulfobacteriota bacterium]